MMETLSRKTTPGGTRQRKSTVASSSADKPSDSGELVPTCKMESEPSGSQTDNGRTTDPNEFYEQRNITILELSTYRLYFRREN